MQTTEPAGSAVGFILNCWCSRLVLNVERKFFSECVSRNSTTSTGHSI